MRPYWAVFGAAFRRALQYRLAALAGLATQIFWGLVRVMALTAFYASSTEVQPLSLEEAMSIYAPWVRGLFVFAVPLAFMNYYPLLGVLSRPDPLGLPPWAGWLAPLVGAGFFAMTLVAWAWGVRHYRSTGS